MTLEVKMGELDVSGSSAAAAEAPPAAAAAGSSPAANQGEDKKKQKNKQQPKQKKGDQDAATTSQLGLQATKAGDFPRWYQEIVVAAELISYYQISGCYILRPWAFAMWEAVQAWFDAKIKALGVRNAYFPMFITPDALEREADHVAGFSPEVAWVTRAGTSDLDKPIAIRPTSETVMYPYFAQWVRSHRDLPLRLNQWTNVVRWEFKYPTPFIRSREFLWQEGHTAFATHEEADAEVAAVLDLYAQVYEQLLAVPVTMGRKSEAEKFAGALYTTTVEAFIPETGRGVQGATSHCLGQNFSRMFGIEFEDEQHTKQHAWQNSWGITTRSLGVMIMTHGDDRGLVLPPRVAPTQVIVVPIPKGGGGKASAGSAAAAAAKEAERMATQARALVAALVDAGVRAEADLRPNYTPGWKYNHWELKGVPLRLELGPRDMAARAAVLVRRDTGAKELGVPWDELPARVQALLEQIQGDMLARARARYDACLARATTWDEFMAALAARKMVLAPWADEPAVEEDVKRRSATGDAAGAKTLCIPFEQPPLPEGACCFASGKLAKNWALWGRSY